MPQTEAATPNPLFEQYAAYTADTEPMWWYHRWCLYSAIGALLGRRFYFQHGHFRVNPNLYTMLIGDTGSRKSSAIKLVGKIARQVGGLKFAADRGSKEKFLAEMEGETNEDGTTLLDKTAIELFGSSGSGDEPREIYVVADEFNDFIGTNNIEFASLLGTLWDYEGIYEYKIKTGNGARVPDPTVNILGGNTAQGITIAFPQELLNQGFFGRLIIIYGEKSGRKITFPAKPPEDETQKLIATLQKIQLTQRGAATLTASAEKVLDAIYQSWPDAADVRFRSFSNRRFPQLLKLALCNAAGRMDTCINEADVILANTVLSAAEELMPKALGEFGKAKNSGVATKVLEVLNATNVPLTIVQVWKHVHKDLSKIQELGEIFQGLEQADKVQHIKQKGWLPKKAARRDLQYVDWNLLSKEEQMLLSKA